VEDAGLKAIASPRRREMLRLVWEHELTSSEIAGHFDISWPAVSQNLRVLEEVGFMKCRRAGTTRYYRADRRRLGPLKKILLEMWGADLDRLSALAESEHRGGNR
jgi:DNA-binding transcriptional ArsR family regulator